MCWIYFMCVPILVMACYSDYGWIFFVRRIFILNFSFLVSFNCLDGDLYLPILGKSCKDNSTWLVIVNDRLICCQEVGFNCYHSIVRWCGHVPLWCSLMAGHLFLMFCRYGGEFTPLSFVSFTTISLTLICKVTVALQLWNLIVKNQLWTDVYKSQVKI